MAVDPSGIPNLQHKRKTSPGTLRPLPPASSRHTHKKKTYWEKEEGPFQMLRLLSKVRRPIRTFRDTHPLQRPFAKLGRKEATFENIRMAK